MKRKALAGLAAAWLLVALWSFLEGGLYFSTAKPEDWQDLLPSRPALGQQVAVGRGEEVIVAAYELQEDPAALYVLEFGRNRLFDRYSLRDRWQWQPTDGEAFSVASSAANHYVYRLDLKPTPQITVDPPTGRVSLWTPLLFAGAGVITLLLLFRKKEQ